MSRGADRPHYSDLVWDSVVLVRPLSVSVALDSWVTLSLPVILSSLVSGTRYKNMVKLFSSSLLTTKADIK